MTRTDVRPVHAGAAGGPGTERAAARGYMIPDDTVTLMCDEHPKESTVAQAATPQATSDVSSEVGRILIVCSEFIIVGSCPSIESS